MCPMTLSLNEFLAVSTEIRGWWELKMRSGGQRAIVPSAGLKKAAEALS